MHPGQPGQQLGMHGRRVVIVRAAGAGGVQVLMRRECAQARRTEQGTRSSTRQRTGPSRPPPPDPAQPL